MTPSNVGLYSNVKAYTKAFISHSLVYRTCESSDARPPGQPSGADQDPSSSRGSGEERANVLRPGRSKSPHPSPSRPRSSPPSSRSRSPLAAPSRVKPSRSLTNHNQWERRRRSPHRSESGESRLRSPGRRIRSPRPSVTARRVRSPCPSRQSSRPMIRDRKERSVSIRSPCKTHGESHSSLLVERAKETLRDKKRTDKLQAKQEETASDKVDMREKLRQRKKAADKSAKKKPKKSPHKQLQKAAKPERDVGKKLRSLESDEEEEGEIPSPKHRKPRRLESDEEGEIPSPMIEVAAPSSELVSSGRAPSTVAADDVTEASMEELERMRQQLFSQLQNEDSADGNSPPSSDKAAEDSGMSAHRDSSTTSQQDEVISSERSCSGVVCDSNEGDIATKDINSVSEAHGTDKPLTSKKEEKSTPTCQPGEEASVFDLMQPSRESSVADLMQPGEKACVSNVMQSGREACVSNVMQPGREACVVDVVQPSREACVADVIQPGEKTSVVDVMQSEALSDGRECEAEVLNPSSSVVAPEKAISVSKTPKSLASMEPASVLEPTSDVQTEIQHSSFELPSAKTDQDPAPKPTEPELIEEESSPVQSLVLSPVSAIGNAKISTESSSPDVTEMTRSVGATSLPPDDSSKEKAITAEKSKSHSPATSSDADQKVCHSTTVSLSTGIKKSSSPVGDVEPMANKTDVSTVAHPSKLSTAIADIFASIKPDVLGNVRSALTLLSCTPPGGSTNKQEVPTTHVGVPKPKTATRESIKGMSSDTQHSFKLCFLPEHSTIICNRPFKPEDCWSGGS